MFRTVDQDLDGVDHLRFAPILAFRLLAEFDQQCRVEKGIGVALETARVPGQVYQKAVQYPLRIGGCGLFVQRGRADLAQLCPLRPGEKEALVGMIGIEEVPVVADRLTRCGRLPDIVPDFSAFDSGIPAESRALTVGIPAVAAP